MPKNKHNHHREADQEGAGFRVFTRKDGQSLVRDNMAFSHNLLQRKDTVTGILTVASLQSRLTGESNGHSALNCLGDQYYALMLSAISTILSAMDEHNILAKFGLDKDELATETLGYLIVQLEKKLNLENLTEEEFEHLVSEDLNVLELLDNHYSSLATLGLLDEEGGFDE